MSAEAGRIRRAWRELTDEECQAVLVQLQRMTAEAGWHPDQQAAAEAALRVIRDQAA